MENNPSSPNNCSMITMNHLTSPALLSPPLPPPPIKCENRRNLIKKLREKKNILQVGHRRWQKRNHQITMILLSFLSIYAIVLVGVIVMPIKYSFDCMYSTAQTAMGIIGILYTLKCGKTLKFTNKQLLENRKKKNELKRLWEELKQHSGVADEEELDAWFVDEASPSSSSHCLVHAVAPAAGFLFSVVAAASIFYFMLQCWFRCGIKSVNCVY